MSVPLMGPCMLDDGLDPPHMDTSPLPSAKLGLVGAKWEQSPSLFSGRYTESCFCCFIMCSHHRGCQRVKNLCESDGAGTAFSFWSCFWTNHICWSSDCAGSLFQMSSIFNKWKLFGLDMNTCKYFVKLLKSCVK